MMLGAEQKKVVKVGVLGDKIVGKTYLSHRLAGLSYEGYTLTTEITEMKSQQLSKGTKFVYVDNPALDQHSIANIASVLKFDVLLFLFKDCQSFTKLYEFFEAINKAIKNGVDQHVQHYWQHLKKIFVVYSNFQSNLPVQLDQLFEILTEEIGYFSSNSNFQAFALEKGSQNWKDLKVLIEKEHVAIQLHQEILEISNAEKLQKILEKEQILEKEPQEKKSTGVLQLSEERANFLEQEKSEVILLNNDEQQIRQTEIPVASAQKQKDGETTSAEVIKAQRKSRDNNVVIQSQEIKNESQKPQQIIQITQKDVKQIQKSNDQLNKRTLQKPQTSQNEKEYKIEEVRIQQIIEQPITETTKKQEIRRQTILKKIQQSFFKSSMQVQLSKNSYLQNEDVPKEYIQVKKHSPANLLPGFRETQSLSDPKVDIQLNKYIEQKVQKLKNYVEISEDEAKLRLSKEQRNSLEQYNGDRQLIVTSTNQKSDGKNGPELQIDNRRRPLRQQQPQGQAKCSCCLM